MSLPALTPAPTQWMRLAQDSSLWPWANAYPEIGIFPL